MKTNIRIINWARPATEAFPDLQGFKETLVRVIKPGCMLARVDGVLRLLVVPEGFVCDQSSVPDAAARLFGVLKSDLSPWGLFHDAAYRANFHGAAFALPNGCPNPGIKDVEGLLHYAITEGTEQRLTRLQADDLFLAALCKYNASVLGSNRLTRAIRAKKAYAAVRLFGKSSFHSIVQMNAMREAEAAMNRLSATQIRASA